LAITLRQGARVIEDSGRTSAAWSDKRREDGGRGLVVSARMYFIGPRPGMIKSTPTKIVTQGTDWRFFNELKRELKS
jgi:hypothetical protein